jgi:hypothetical protein
MVHSIPINLSFKFQACTKHLAKNWQFCKFNLLNLTLMSGLCFLEVKDQKKNLKKSPLVIFKHNLKKMSYFTGIAAKFLIMYFDKTILRRFLDDFKYFPNSCYGL